MSDTVLTDLLKDAASNDGVVDAMMTTVVKYLDAEFKKNRITGTEYSNVFLGSIQAVVSQAVAYNLGLRTANAQAGLLEAQTLTEAQNLLSAIEQTALTTEEKNLVLAQIAKVTAETALIGQKQLTEVNETARVLAVIDQVIADEALLVAKGLTEAQTTLLTTSQKLKIDAEELLIDQKTLTEVQETARITAETTRVNSDKLRLDAETTLLASKDATEIATELKVDAETALLALKQETEKGQHSDTLIDGITTVAGIVGAQKGLFDQQKQGFLRDAEQKALKILMDSWAVDKSTDVGGTVVIPSNANNTGLNAVIAKVTTGIGA